jgi:hypothetical protein
MSFLQNSIARLQEYKRLAEKAIAQISDEALLHDAGGENNNSIVVIIKHMHGNMLSRWTNFLTEDGEKPWRQRDDEFEHEAMSREQLLTLWEEGWQCMFNALMPLTEEDLAKNVLIRGEKLTVTDAIVRQLMHYAYHIGQIVLLCKQEAAEGWASLSIPKGGSAAFNTSMAAAAERKKQA